jgi:hypothetical protein
VGRNHLSAPATTAAPPPLVRERRRSLAGRLKALASNRLVQTVAAAIAYSGFAVYLTWPLASDLDGRIFGAAGDLTGALSTFREVVESGGFPFAPTTLHDFSAPEGLPLRWTLNIATFPSFGIVYALTGVFGPVAAIGLYTLLGLSLSGLAMFLLVRRLTNHAGVAFLAGYVYAFYPFVVVKAQGHVDYVHGWVMVVPLWRLIELMLRPTLRNGVWAGLALVLACAWTPYHILFAGVMGIAVGVVALGFAWRDGTVRATLGALTVAGAIALTWLGGVALLDRAGPRSEVRTHSVAEAIAFSARAEEYVIPTSRNPIVGDQAGEYRTEHLHGSNAAENSIYLGVTVLALAALGLLFSLRSGGTLRRVAVAALAVSAAGFAFSAPPEVTLFGSGVSTPTRFLFDITTSWRVFSRLVVVVMAGLAPLAGLGALAIVRQRPPAFAAALLAVLLAIVATDLWARPLHGTNKLVIPPTYGKLAQLPDGIAVEYPLLPAEHSQYGDVLFQGWHDKPIVNGYYQGSGEENRAVLLDDLSRPSTARGLAALGVRYVLVRQDIRQASLPDPGRPGREYRLVARDPYIALYTLDAPRQQTLIAPMEGFGVPERGPDGPRFQWLQEREGVIEVRGNCSPCTGTVSMTVRNFAQPHDVKVEGPDGRVLSQARIGDPRRLRFRVSFDRRMELKVSADPGPQSIDDTIGGGDPRSVSISLDSVSFALDRHRRSS